MTTLNPTTLNVLLYLSVALCMADLVAYYKLTNPRQFLIIGPAGGFALMSALMLVLKVPEIQGLAIWTFALSVFLNAIVLELMSRQRQSG